MLHDGEPRGEPNSSVTWLAEPRSSNIAIVGHIEPDRRPHLSLPLLKPTRATGKCLDLEVSSSANWALALGFRKRRRQRGKDVLMGRLTYSWAAST